MADARRDRWGRYMVLPPGRRKPTGYTRVTTIAKELDGQGGLMPWKATATVVGAMRRPGLRARWEALIAQHPDPWYGSPESKAACKKLVEECSEAGGSTDRADQGTALHAVLELMLRDPSRAPLLQDGMRADVEAFQRTVSAEGLIIDPAYIEAMVVLDEHGAAGTSDQLRITVPGIGDVVGDLKTGADLKYSWNSIAVQLSAYANADAVYMQGAAADGSQDERRPMPELRKDLGLVIHLPAGEARCELHWVDLTAGWEAFQISMWKRGWGKRTVAFSFESKAPGTADAAPAFDEPTVVVNGVEIPVSYLPPPGVTSTVMAPTEAQSVDVPAGAPAPCAPAGPPPFDEPVTADRVTADRPTSGTFFPEAQPSPVAGVPDASGGGDGSVTAGPPPFDEPAPTASPAPDSTPSKGAQRAAMRKRGKPDEGERIEDCRADKTKPETRAKCACGFCVMWGRFEALQPDAKTWVLQLMNDASTAGVPFHASTHTQRRFEIVRALLMMAEDGGADMELLRALVALVMQSDAPLFPAVTPGYAVGALSASEAAQFAQLAEAFTAGRLVGAIDTDGVFRLAPAAA